MATVAAIYARVSVKDDTSNARQLERCKAYVKAKGWTVGPVFQERGIHANDPASSTRDARLVINGAEAEPSA